MVRLFRGRNEDCSPQNEGLFQTTWAIDAEVDLCLNEGAYLLRARLNVSLAGLLCDVAQALADAAQQTCPYSKATRGNIDVTINLV